MFKPVGPFSYVLFSLVRAIWIAYHTTVWLVMGYAGLYRSTYEKSARIERILWRSKACIFSPIKPWQFLGAHDGFEHPDYVLRDDVILCSITPHEAMFIQLPTSVREFDGVRFPFLWITLFDRATRTIRMPLESLMRLAESDDRVKTIHQNSMLMSNSGRCGSTLLAKLVQLACPRVLVLSEPDTIQCLHEFRGRLRAQLTDRGYLRLVRACMLLQFKPIEGVEALVIKNRVMCMSTTRYVCESTPELRHVYVQRADRLKTIRSWERAFGTALEARLFTFVCHLGLAKFIARAMYNGEEEELRLVRAGERHLRWTQLELFAMIWTDNLLSYQYCRDKYGMEAIVYEDMTKDPLGALETTFRILGLHKKNGRAGHNGYIDDVRALSGLGEDSQKGTPLAMEALGERKGTRITPDVMRRLNSFMIQMGQAPFIEEATAA